jgi:hypothetical protein
VVNNVGFGLAAINFYGIDPSIFFFCFLFLYGLMTTYIVADLVLIAMRYNYFHILAVLLYTTLLL